MGKFYIDFKVTRYNKPVAGAVISYRSNASSNTTPDTTDKYGKVRTDWVDFWEGKTVEVYCNGEYQFDLVLERQRKVPEYRIELARSSCFPAETRVLTPQGEVCITELRRGDTVLSLAISGQTLAASKPQLQEAEVLHIFQHPPAQLYELHFAEHPPLRLTRNHRLLSQRGFVVAGELQVGDTLHVAAGEPRTITQVRGSHQLEPVYNLVTSGEFNFVVNGYTAHNFTRLPQLQAALWCVIATLRASLRPTWCLLTSPKSCVQNR